MKHSKNKDEICYPFIFESSYLADFEVTTDELCGHVGAILATAPDGIEDIHADLEQLQPLVFHINGSIRGRLAVQESDIEWLHARYVHYQQEVAGRIGGFVLPRGSAPIPQLHLARSATKKALRAMVRVELEGKEIPAVLPRICNLMCNFFFVLTMVINQRRGFV